MNSTKLTKLNKEDILYVANNMREMDRIEIFSGRWTDDIQDFADSIQTDNGFGFVAGIEGTPIAVFGAIPISPTLWNVYMFATDRFPEVSLTVTRFVKKVMIPSVEKMGMFRAECRSIDGHRSAHRWLSVLGFKHEAVCELVGKDGQTFHLFAFTYSGKQTG